MALAMCYVKDTCKLSSLLHDNCTGQWRECLSGQNLHSMEKYFNHAVTLILRSGVVETSLYAFSISTPRVE